ncbi:MAG: geranylgeranyl reductase family protein [Actinomycetota bacterium]|nr:geranylgeranyl reductase family protein [Actinomycetota bacterium]
MTGRLDADVLVVGAGPAGSSASATLARRGLDVVVADRARFPRDKCCGDGLTTGALRRLERLGLEPRHVPSFTWVRGLSVLSPDGRLVDLPLDRGGSPAAAVARRTDLDAALLALARSAGATVLEHSSLEALEVGHDGERPCRARLAGGTEVRSRYVVGADGAWSTVRSLLGAAPRREASRAAGGWHAFRSYATTSALRSRELLVVAFEPGLLPGYLWSFPVGAGAANVGIALRRGPGTSGRALAAAWREALASTFLTSLLGEGAALESPARSWPIPDGIDRVEVSDRSGRVLYAGDAAHAADPFTGEGIAQALHTGTAAAEALAEGSRRDPGGAARRYAAEVRRTLAVEHRIGRALSSVASRALGAEAIVRAAGVSASTRRAAGRWLFEDVPRSLPLSPSTWRRGVLGAPAPYVGSRTHADAPPDP